MSALLTYAQRAKLLANGRRSAVGGAVDPVPVVKLLTPDAGAPRLLTELDPDDPDLAFGLCDLGLGCPELGSVRLSEIAAVRGGLGLMVVRDRWFRGVKPLSAYAAEALRAGTIVSLMRAAFSGPIFASQLAAIIQLRQLTNAQPGPTHEAAATSTASEAQVGRSIRPGLDARKSGRVGRS